MHAPRVAFLFAAFLCFLPLTAAWSQGTSTAPQSAAQQSSPQTSAPISAPARDESAPLGTIKSEFDELRLWAWIVIFAAAAAGLAVYRYMHKRIMEYDSAAGLVTVLILAPILFWFAQMFVLATGSVCLHMDIVVSTSPLPLDEVCRAGREHAANSVGLRSLWSLLSSQQAIEGVLAPIAPGVIKFLMYLSAIVGSSVLYLIFKPVIKRQLNR